MNLIKIDKMLSCKFTNMAFVCACLVVLIHVLVRPVRGSALWWISGILGADGIARVAVPFFFFAAGFFIAGKYEEELLVNWRKECLKRCKTLVLPYEVIAKPRR